MEIVANSERESHLFNESIRIVSLSAILWFVTSELCESFGGFSLSPRGFCLPSDTSKPPNRMWRSKTVASAPVDECMHHKIRFPIHISRFGTLYDIHGESGESSGIFNCIALSGVNFLISWCTRWQRMMASTCFSTQDNVNFLIKTRFRSE